jgi:hypothetical protein
MKYTHSINPPSNTNINNHNKRMPILLPVTIYISILIEVLSYSSGGKKNRFSTEILSS